MTLMDNDVVIVTGATGTAGRSVCRGLLDAGATVVGTGHDPGRLAELESALPGVHTYDIDLADSTAVQRLADDVRDAYGRIDGLIHLVGGWRGGSTFDANTDEDWAFLSSGLIGTLRHLTLALHHDLARSPAGRAAIVSSTAVDAPTAGNANYVTAKAAAEAWMLALADSFRPADGAAATAAAVIFAVKAFVDPTMRADAPTRTFPGFTDVGQLAVAVIDLFSADPAALNGSRIVLPPWDAAS
jgi:NAD(P)-dependent dehydrogenase (short-subunit alcohol dehydrogenase family)